MEMSVSLCKGVQRQWTILTISLSYRFAIRSFCGATFVGSEHDGSVEFVEQSGRMMSEPTQSCDSLRHQDDVLEFVMGFELEFEYGPGPVELELTFPESPVALELDPDLRHARFKPSENLPAIDSAGTNFPYAAIVSIAHLSWTSDHQFWEDWMHSVVQRSVTFSVVQR